MLIKNIKHAIVLFIRSLQGVLFAYLLTESF